jgi:hypothetical protein
MFVIRRENEWLKEILTIEEGKERLQQHNGCGWSFVDYLHMPKNTLEFDKWKFFVDKFKSMLENIQELILKKLHGGTKIWCIQLCTLIIDTTKLTKYKRWLLVLVCLLTLAEINKTTAAH